MLETLKAYVREHQSQLVVTGIMAGIMVVIGLMATGDFTPAMGGRARG